MAIQQLKVDRSRIMDAMVQRNSKGDLQLVTLKVEHNLEGKMVAEEWIVINAPKNAFHTTMVAEAMAPEEREAALKNLVPTPETWEVLSRMNNLSRTLQKHITISLMKMMERMASEGKVLVDPKGNPVISNG